MVWMTSKNFRIILFRLIKGMKWYEIDFKVKKTHQLTSVVKMRKMRNQRKDSGNDKWTYLINNKTWMLSVISFILNYPQWFSFFFYDLYILLQNTELLGLSSARFSPQDCLII